MIYDMFYNLKIIFICLTYNKDYFGSSLKYIIIKHIIYFIKVLNILVIKCLQYS